MKRYAPYRRAAAWIQAVVILGLPFLRINGESALRFDIPSLRLFFFGTSIWMQEFFLILLALLFLLFLIALFTVLLGRVWCGWVCPQTVLSDLTESVESARPPFRRFAAHLRVLIVSIIVGASLVWYFVSPYDFMERLLHNRLGPVLWGFWIVHTVILYLDLAFLRRRFCKTVCPYAKMQSVLYDDRTLIIAFDQRRAEECMNCQACVMACPVGMDIRKGLDVACINCAKCVDTCAKQTARVQKKTLIDYFWGLPGSTGRLLRANVLFLGAVSLALFVALMYVSAARVPFEMFARRNVTSRTLAETHGPVERYRITLRNLRDYPMQITFDAVGGELEDADPVSLPPLGSAEVTLGIRQPGDAIGPVRLTATDADGEHSVTLPLKVRKEGSKK